MVNVYIYPGSAVSRINNEKRFSDKVSASIKSAAKIKDTIRINPLCYLNTDSFDAKVVIASDIPVNKAALKKN